MKCNLRCAVFILSAWSMLTLTAAREAAAQSGGVSWQQSQVPSVTLGVRDKYGTLGGYTARFVIIDSGGHRTQKSIPVRADAFGFITYPDDALSYPPDWRYSGTYTWVCLVRGQVAARGKFSLTDTPDGQQIRTMGSF